MQGGQLTVALVYGGRSAEHDVSLRSAASIFEAMDRNKYRVIPILITREGGWYERPGDISSFAPQAGLCGTGRLLLSADPADGGFLRVGADGRLEPMQVDVVFPVLHGSYGEDGTVQGLLEMANIPYVGCGVLASAVGMDKILMKGAFRDNGLHVGPFFWFTRSQWRLQNTAILERLGQSCFPVFVKPANLGSSVGISRVSELRNFQAAVDRAAPYDRKILVEDGIVGRELEVSVLGNDEPKASVAGEVVSHSEFYDYEEKYHRDTAKLIIPAQLSARILEKAQAAAVTAFRAVDGAGLARVDMFLTPDGCIIVNEINTLPGFTSVSMYPKLWEATGLNYPSLIDNLIDLAVERYRDKQQTSTHRDRQ